MRVASVRRHWADALAGFTALHMGQMVFTTKMLREAAIRDLWKRTRAL